MLADAREVCLEKLVFLYPVARHALFHQAQKVVFPDDDHLTLLRACRGGGAWLVLHQLHHTYGSTGWDDVYAKAKVSLQHERGRPRHGRAPGRPHGDGADGSGLLFAQFVKALHLTLNQEVDIIWWITLPKEDCAGTKGNLLYH